MAELNAEIKCGDEVWSNSSDSDDPENNSLKKSQDYVNGVTSDSDDNEKAPTKSVSTLSFLLALLGTDLTFYLVNN